MESPELPPVDPFPIGVLTAWETLSRQIKVDGALTNTTVQDLNAIFQKLLPSALEIIDRGWVQKVTALPSHRTLHIIRGKSQSQYVCLPDYCPCPHFSFSVIPGEALMCKHLLAIALRECLAPPLEPKPISDAEYAQYVTLSTAPAPTHTAYRNKP
eukprot:Sspe_Gene.117967::Locus_110382_Transcript_1_1_Confidence_1.000_Length_603::g.117967::m.117967